MSFSSLGGLLGKPWAAFLACVRWMDAKASGLIDAVNPYDLAKIKARALDPVQIEESPVRKLSAKIFLGFFAMFLIWAVVAPIDQGVYVPGSVAVAGNRQQVQHPSGGVVMAILVKEGDSVEADQILMQINPLSSEANLTGAELQYINLLATESRLKAEREGRGSIEWFKALDRYAKDSRSKEAREIQQKLFTSRRAEYADNLRSQRIQVETLTQEANNAAQLAKEGFMPQAQASAALRAKASAEAALSQLINGRSGEIDKELAETQKNREALEQRVQSLAFDAARNEVRAPVAGVVSGLKVNTIGGVISSSQILMEIVPATEDFVIEARVPTSEIDKVRVGMEANVRFAAFNERTTPVIPAKVTLVGADKIASDKVVDFTSSNSQGEYYIARLEITAEGAGKLADNRLQPGMPADVIIKSGERNFVSYLFKPLTDSFAQAFLN